LAADTSYARTNRHNHSLLLVPDLVILRRT